MQDAWPLEALAICGERDDGMADGGKHEHKKRGKKKKKNVGILLGFEVPRIILTVCA